MKEYGFMVLTALAALVASFARPAAAQGNLIVNGDFDGGLSGWTAQAVSIGNSAPFGSYPQIGVKDSGCIRDGNNHAFLDVPHDSDGYLEQAVDLQGGPGAFSFLAWGNLDPVNATVSVIDQSGAEHVLDQFTPPPTERFIDEENNVAECIPGAAPTLKAFDLSPFIGQEIRVRFRATSPFGRGTFLNIDEVQISRDQCPGTVMAAKQGNTCVLLVNDAGDSPDFDLSDGTCDVDDEQDDEQCTLRAAIENANDFGPDVTIAFDVPGGSPPTISVTGSLASLSHSVVIDGTTQPGSALVVVDGSAAGAGTDGLTFEGGQGTLRGLVLTSFTGHGLVLRSDDNLIEGNHLLDNGGHGIHVVDASGNRIGSLTLPDLANVIRGNDGSGVVVEGASSQRNAIRGNIITGNTGLAIDLAGDGPTANDLRNSAGQQGLLAHTDQDTGPNALVNFPAGVTAAPSRMPGHVVISGVLDTPDPAAAHVDIYAAPSAHMLERGEADVYVGTATPNAAGAFLLEVPVAALGGHAFLSAIATDAVGAGSTSELSPVCDGDADGDGLCNNWETSGIDYDGDGSADLILTGASPNKKDLFVEYDWMDGGHSHEPVASGLQDLAVVFRASPAAAELHLERGEALPHLTPLRFSSDAVAAMPMGSFDDLKRGNPANPCGTGASDGHFGSVADRGAANCAVRLGARRLAFRYLIFGHDHAHFPGSSGMAELPGNDFLVTIGSWSNASLRTSAGLGPMAPVVQARRRVEVATVMHEMGHTLGLRHGGGDDINCKPNYPSIMSYGLQFEALVPNRRLDFAQVAMPTLDKNSLDETMGLQGPANRMVVYKQTGMVKAVRTNEAPIDWDGVDNDGDGVADNDVVTGNINDVKASCGAVAADNLLTGHEDWSVLQYNFRLSPDFADGLDRTTPDAVEPEMTEEEATELADVFDFDGDGLPNAMDNCAAQANPAQEDADGNGIGDACAVEAGAPQAPEPSAPEDGADVAIPVALVWQAVAEAATYDVHVAEVEDFSVVAVDTAGVATTTVEVTELVGGRPYFWRVRGVNELGAGPWSLPRRFTTMSRVAADEEAGLPYDYMLEPNYPNPFNPTTTIRYALPKAGLVRLVVYDALGREVAVLVDGQKPAGRHEVAFEARGLPSGVYLARLMVDARVIESRTVMLIR